jgi:ubiquinone/menaquinone biosynthesis C-methylase UbiE
MDKVNIKLTETILEEIDSNPSVREAGLRRNKEAFETFKHWIVKPVLEVGCRQGVLLSFIGGEDLYGIDISELALKRFQFNGANANAEQLPFKSESFNTVFALHVIEHCRNTDEAIKEIHRVLIPGGHLLLELPLQKKEPVPTKWGHWYCFETEEEILKKFNFLFKKIKVFKKINKPWRRIVFKK